ncbi:MAG: permease prefix domain 1-containing protein [Ruminococcus sp.]|nr:permease prefix domain 1-containing protein [Ruminococcus sp.]
MQLPEIVSHYLDQAVPSAVSEKKHKKLTDELECHICDKAEHYMEIGYTEADSFKKAVEEMGSSSILCEKFNELYGEKKLHAVIFGAVLMLLHLLLRGSGYFIYATSYGTIDRALLGILYVVGIMTAIFAAYKLRKKYTLLAIGASLLMCLLLRFNGLFFIFTSALVDNVSDFVRIAATHIFKMDQTAIQALSEKLYNVDVTLSVSSALSFTMLIASVIACVYLFFKIKNAGKKKSHKINEKAFQRAVATMSLVVAFTGAFNLVSVAQAEELSLSPVYGMISDEIISLSESKKTKTAFDRINNQTTGNMADEIFRSCGLVPYEELYPDVKGFTDTPFLNDSLYDFEKNHPVKIYIAKSHPINLYGCDNYIMISDTADKPIEFKHIKIENEIYYPEFLQKNHDIDAAKKYVDSLKPDVDSIDALKGISDSLATLSSITEFYSSGSFKSNYVYISESIDETSDYDDYESSTYYGFDLTFENDKLIQIDSKDESEVEDPNIEDYFFKEIFSTIYQFPDFS